MKSRRQPGNKVIVFKNKENFYLYSQNCICFQLFGRNLVISPLQGIESSIELLNGKNNITEIKDGMNLASDDVTASTESEFFLNYFQKLRLVYFFKDRSLVEFYHNYYNSGYRSGIKDSENSNNSPSLIGTFAIFEVHEKSPTSFPKFRLSSSEPIEGKPAQNLKIESPKFHHL